MNKKFDCVEMKHKAAGKIYHRISKMTREEELKYWSRKTKNITPKKSISKKLTKV